MADVKKRREVIRVLTIAANHADEGMISFSVDEVREIVELLKEQEPRILSLEEAIEGKNGLEIDRLLVESFFSF